MTIYTMYELRVGVATGKLCHHIVNLSFEFGLYLNLSMEASKVLRQFLFKSRPHELLRVELATVCRQEQYFERLVVSDHLSTVVC